MSDDEDDYLSDKFLARLEAASKPQQPKSYTERRKQALKQSQLLNQHNQQKSRKQMELEAREEGLQTNLIQKAQEEAKQSGKQNKALAIMMKMGFKPGQSLGESHEESSSPSSIGGNIGSSHPADTSGAAEERDSEADTSTPPSEPRTSALAAYKHRAEPLPIKEWSGKPHSSSLTMSLIPDSHLPSHPLPNICVTTLLSLSITTGKTGIGGVKRPPSPSILERAAKMARQSEVLSAGEFRDRARREYEDRRAEGMLRSVRTTCVNLDTEANVEVRRQSPFLWISISYLIFPSIQFNRFWLDSAIPGSFPPGLLEALGELLSSSPLDVPDPGSSDISKSGKEAGTGAGTAARLKAQMQADSLRPLHPVSAGSDEDDGDGRPLLGIDVDSDQKDPGETVAVWPEETLLQVGDYLQLSVSCFLCFPLLGYRLGHRPPMLLPISNLHLSNHW